MKKLGISVALLLVACGGKVVVDNPGSGGGGSSPIGPGYCIDAPDPASLTFCGSSAGTEGSCVENDWCATDGTMWSAVCSTQACSCRHDGKTVCVCSLTSAGDFCTGTPTCCPFTNQH